MRPNVLLVTSYATASLIDLGAPLVLAVFIARRWQGRWRYWAVGVLVFLLSQALTRVPLMVWLQSRPPVHEALKQPHWFWPFLFAAALTAGLCEEGGRWLAFRFLVPPGERRWHTALMLGAGHGGLESALVGLVTLAALVGYLVVTMMPPETFGAAAPQVEAARQQFARQQGWEPLLGAWERLGALLIQLALTVLVLQAFLRGGRWWWYALAAHTVVDFTTVAVLSLAAARWGAPAGMLLTEGLVAVYAVLAVWLVAALRPPWNLVALPSAGPGPSEPVGMAPGAPP
jgi:uncharacterized membrane protein YhfC